MDGNRRAPRRKELLAVGIAAGMKKQACVEIMDMIYECVSRMLGKYLGN